MKTHTAAGFIAIVGACLERVLLGHLLGLSSIPLEAAGTYLIYDLLKPAFGARTATASVAIGAYLIALGTAYHACLLPLAHAVQQLDQKAVAAFRSFSEPVAAFLALSFVLAKLEATLPVGLCRVCN